LSEDVHYCFVETEIWLKNRKLKESPNVIAIEVPHSSQVLLPTSSQRLEGKLPTFASKRQPALVFFGGFTTTLLSK